LIHGLFDSPFNIIQFKEKNMGQDQDPNNDNLFDFDSTPRQEPPSTGGARAYETPEETPQSQPYGTPSTSGAQVYAAGPSEPPVGQPVEPPPYSPPPPPYSPAAPPPPAKSNNTRIWIIVAVVLVLLCCCCVVVVFAAAWFYSAEFAEFSMLLPALSSLLG
jgi:hypothetical protein